MRVTAVTKFKNGVIYEALRKLGWTQAELARRAGICPTEIGMVINLRRRPKQRVADAIQKAFAEAGIYLDVIEMWPESFGGFKKSLVLTQTQEVDALQLEGYRERALEDSRHNSDMAELLKDWPLVECELGRLPDRLREAVEGVFLDGRTLSSVARSGQHLYAIDEGEGVTIETIRQRSAKGLRMLRDRLSKQGVQCPS